MTTKKIARRSRARQALQPVYELGAYNVLGFCLAHGLSRRTFYHLRQVGDGPRIMKCGRRTLISIEAAQAWRRARERAASKLRKRGVHRPTGRAQRHRRARSRRRRGE